MVVPERASHWDYFNHLGSSDKQQKFNYAVKLYVLFADSSSDEATRDYILSRIISALGALSDNLRAGAFSLFCLLLSKSGDRCDFDTVIKLIANHLKPTGTAKADAEAYVGLLLAYKAMIQAGYLRQHPDRYTEVANALMELCTQKSYLHCECLQLLGAMISDSKQEYGNEAFVRHLKDLNTSTLDKLHYLLKLERTFDSSETVASVFDGKSLLSVDNATEIGILLAKCHNLEHIFVDDFLDAVADNSKFVAKMWQSYENQICGRVSKSSKAALEMYYNLLMGLLRKMQEKKCYKAVGKIITNLAVETLLKNSKTKPELTKETCKAILDILVAANDSALSAKILEKLVFQPGNFSFDEKTSSRVVSAISGSLATDEMKMFGDKCLDTAVNGNNAKNKDRLNALNFYCALLNKPACSAESKWRLEGMKTLLKAGLVKGDNVSSELAALIRKSFFNTLSVKFATLQANTDVFKELLKSFSSFLSKENSLRIKITEEMKEAWKLSHKLIANLEKKAGKGSNSVIIQALELLASFIGLKSIYESKDTQVNLKDIEAVIKRITKNDNSAEGPEWIEVLMDLFLNMLSKPDVSNRTIINIVFKTMVPHLNSEAFNQLVNVLDPEYDLKGVDKDQSEVGVDQNEDMEGEEESDEDESSDNETEEDNAEEEEKAEEDEEEESEESDDHDEEEGTHAFNQEKLQFELRNALMPGGDSDNESINIDDIDEEQGRQLDATLSAIFKSNLTKKKPFKREDVTSHFRTRVLDLLETYSLTGMPLDHWCRLIPTLLKLANSTIAAKNTAGLKQRLLCFVRKISSVKISDIASENCQISNLVLLLEQLIEQASQATGTALDLRQHYLEFIKFCIRNMNYVHENMATEINTKSTSIVSSAIESFFAEKTSLQLEVVTFFCQFKWPGVHDAAQKVAEFTFNPATKHYKRVQGANSLASYMKSERTFASLSDSEVKVVRKFASSLLQEVLKLKTANERIDMKTQNLIVNLIIEMHNGKASGYVKWKKWKEALPQLLSIPNNKKFKQSFVSLCKKLDMEIESFKDVDDGDSKASLDSEKQQNNSAKKTKKRKQVDARKLKKESKRLRLAAMDDGLENSSWSKLEVDG